MFLNNERRVYLFGEVSNERAEKFVSRLHELYEEGGDPITVFINSVGGSVTDAGKLCQH